MERRPFTLLRALGIFVGLLFVGTAPFVAKTNHAFPSLDGVSYVILVVLMGLAFIGYGVTGISRLPKPPARFTIPIRILVAISYIAIGIYFLLVRERHIIGQLVGAFFLICGALSILGTYSKHRSKPAA